MKIDGLQPLTQAIQGAETGFGRPTLGPGGAGSPQSFEALLAAASRLHPESGLGPTPSGAGPAQAAGPTASRGPIQIDASAWLEGVGPTSRTGAAATPEEPSKASPVALLDGADAQYHRLEELIRSLNVAGPMAPRELLAMQAEIAKISLSLETSTKAVTQMTQDVRTLFQQQI